METTVGIAQAPQEYIRRMEEEFLQKSTPTEFVAYAIEKHLVPIGSAVLFPSDWGPVQ